MHLTGESNHALVSILSLTRNRESYRVLKFRVGRGLAKVFNMSNSQNEQEQKFFQRAYEVYVMQLVTVIIEITTQ